jgi:hypothetical protein
MLVIWGFMIAMGTATPVPAKTGPFATLNACYAYLSARVDMLNAADPDKKWSGACQDNPGVAQQDIKWLLPDELRAKIQ